MSVPFYVRSVQKAQLALRIGVNGLRHEFEDNIRALKAVSSSSVITNDKEIRIIGLRRSGNHAIVNWIRKQESGKTFFINNARPNTNPFRAVYEDQLLKLRDQSIPGWRTENIELWRQEATGNFSPKGCLLHSYEDESIESLGNPSFEKKHDLYFGKSRVRYDLIIVRDPFNLIASRLRAYQRNEPLQHQFDFMQVKSKRISLPKLWVDYAREYLGESNYLRNIKIPVNYNAWVTDSQYRCKIAEKLNLDFTDAGFNDVMTNGGGSSFDGTNLNGRASEMSLLERWRYFSNDPHFKNLISYENLMEYSLRIFGPIPGTDALFDS